MLLKGGRKGGRGGREGGREKQEIIGGWVGRLVSSNDFYKRVFPNIDNFVKQIGLNLFFLSNVKLCFSHSITSCLS